MTEVLGKIQNSMSSIQNNQQMAFKSIDERFTELKEIMLKYFSGNGPQATSKRDLPLNNLPFPRNGYFSGRSEFLHKIWESFGISDSGNIIQTLTGMGGIGKTQIALEYAYKNKAEYPDAIWWIQAERKETILEDFRKLIEKAGMVADKSDLDENRIKEFLQDWYNCHSKWLFIFDNAENSSDILPWLPKASGGNILITTRKNNFPLGDNIPLDLFSLKEGIDFIKQRNKRLENDSDIEILIERLGFLPLALEQASAYMIKTDRKIADYTRLLDKHGLELLKKMLN
jgi:hypothetical protein